MQRNADTGIAWLLNYNFTCPATGPPHRHLVIENYKHCADMKLSHNPLVTLECSIKSNTLGMHRALTCILQAAVVLRKEVCIRDPPIIPA